MMPASCAAPGLDDVGQRRAGQELHHDERATVRRRADIDDVDDVRVADPARCVGLALEPRDRLGVIAVLFEHQLDGDALAELDVLGLVHHAHAAAPDLMQHAVLVREDVPDQRVTGGRWLHRVQM
jgi:hypothetical protein